METLYVATKSFRALYFDVDFKLQIYTFLVYKEVTYSYFGLINRRIILIKGTKLKPL